MVLGVLLVFQCAAGGCLRVAPRAACFGRALQSKQKPLPGRLARASAPAEVSIVVFVPKILLGVMIKERFSQTGAPPQTGLIRIQSRELALKADSNVTIRVYNSTLLGSLKTGALR